nr:MAG TPA: hypothetical protein [Bacteriophage sp.]
MHSASERPSGVRTISTNNIIIICVFPLGRSATDGRRPLSSYSRKRIQTFKILQ